MNTGTLTKNQTYKPKDALRAIGVDIPANQRGRMSRENVDKVKALVSEGYSIVGYGAVKSTDTSTAPVVGRVTEAAANVIAELYYRYDENLYRAVGKSGKVYGMRECCQPCGLSLVGHTCDAPVVLGESVEVVRK